MHTTTRTAESRVLMLALVVTERAPARVPVRIPLELEGPEEVYSFVDSGALADFVCLGMLALVVVP